MWQEVIFILPVTPASDITQACVRESVVSLSKFKQQLEVYIAEAADHDHCMQAFGQRVARRCKVNKQATQSGFKVEGCFGRCLIISRKEFKHLEGHSKLRGVSIFLLEMS